MKLIKIASGIIKKISFSKSDWIRIGQKAGWLEKVEEEELAAAPVKAPVKSPTKTPTPSAPSKQPSKGPFNPPRPKILPNPKAKKQKIKNEKLSTVDNFYTLVKCAQAYQEKSHPSLRKFWGNIPEEHPFYHHPVLKEHGQSLSESGFNYIREHLGRGNKELPSGNLNTLQEILGLLQQIEQIEYEHKEQLIEMAKDITSEVWGIDKSMLSGNIDQDIGSEPQEEQKHNLVPVTPELRSEINKRITMNVLTQGASLHSLSSVHNLVTDKLNTISPELVELYNRVSGLITNHYYEIDIPALISTVAKLSDASIGWSHVEYNEGGEPEVKAEGFCFPVLCQEMFKGVMELISLNGIPQNLNEDELYTVYNYADRLEDEPWEITVGPALWRKLISVMPKDIKLADFVMKISQESPTKINEIINNVIQNPEEAKRYLQGYTQEQEEQREPEQYIDVEKRPAGEIVVPEEVFEGLDDVFPEENKKKKGKGKAAGELVVPEETFEGLEDIFEK